MKEEKFIFESNGNPYQLTDEISDFAHTQIGIATNFLTEFLKTKNSIVTAKRTYRINAPSGLIKIASYKTDFLKNDGQKCSVEISNPFEFNGSRYWTHFSGKGAFWTNKSLLVEKNVNSDIVFNLLAQNHEWIYRQVELIQIKRKKGEEVSAEDYSLENVNLSPNVDYSPRVVSDKEKEEVAFEVFEKIFNGK